MSQNEQEYGARPLRRAATATLEDALADAMLRGTLVPGDSVLAKLSAAATVEAAAGHTPLMGPAAVRSCSMHACVACFCP
jgi:C-terminal, D2-small domain, of ClpB protein